MRDCAGKTEYGYGTRTPGNQAPNGPNGTFKETFAESHILTQQFLVLNSETALELEWLRDVDSSIVCACPSYEEFLNSRNVRVGQMFQGEAHAAMMQDIPKERWRLKLDQFISVHSLYALLHDLRRTDLLTTTPLPCFTTPKDGRDLDLLSVIEEALPRMRKQFTIDFMQHKNTENMCCGPVQLKNSALR